MVILKPKEVSKILNVTVNTLQRWDRENILNAKRMAGTNRRYYTEEDINSFLGKKNRISNNVVIYSRVSNVGQKDDLKNQIEYLKNYASSKGYIISNIISDIGSGLNYNRKNWNILLSDIISKKISKVIISHKDRFVRFGFDWFFNFASKYGCEIEIVNNEITSPQEEMVKDLISIIHVFSCRIYGLRKYKNKISCDKEL